MEGTGARAACSSQQRTHTLSFRFSINTFVDAVNNILAVTHGRHFFERPSHALQVSNLSGGVALVKIKELNGFTYGQRASSCIVGVTNHLKQPSSSPLPSSDLSGLHIFHKGYTYHAHLRTRVACTAFAARKRVLLTSHMLIAPPDYYATLQINKLHCLVVLGKYGTWHLPHPSLPAQMRCSSTE